MHCCVVSQLQIDFGIILALLIVNALIGFIEEARAESAIGALRSSLALSSKVVRSGHVVEVPARDLLPGDILSLRLGDIVPADCELLGLNSNFEETKMELSVDQSALNGESLPASKKKGDSCWSGSIVKQGQMLAIVTHTGADTFLGRAAHLIAITQDSGHFQAVITKIGNFIIFITLVRDLLSRSTLRPVLCLSVCLSVCLSASVSVSSVWTNHTSLTPLSLCACLPAHARLPRHRSYHLTNAPDSRWARALICLRRAWWQSFSWWLWQNTRISSHSCSTP